MEDNETNQKPPDRIISSPPDNGTLTTTTVLADTGPDRKGGRKPLESNDDPGLEGIEPKPTDPIMVDDRASKEEGEEGGTHTVPDGGYGWFIVLGGFLAHIIIGGLERSAGIYFLQFQKKFHKNAQLTAWPGALLSAVRSFMGPLAGALSIRYSVRTICLVGAIIQFVAIILNGFAPDFFFLFFSQSLLQGVGAGLVYAPSISIVSMYFEKRRGLATGIAVSGGGIGTFGLVPVSQMLFDMYGYQGAFMLIAAISLNGAVCAMLYRPLNLHSKFQKGKDNKKENGTGVNDVNVAGNALENANVGKKEGDTIEVKKEDEGFRTVTIKTTSPVETGGKEKSKKSIFNLHLCKNPPFLMFCLSNMLSTASIKSFFTFIPPLVTSFGFSESEGAFVLSVYGVTDTIGRICVGLLFDFGPFAPIRTILYTVLIYCMAVVSSLLPFYQNYAALCFLSAMYGLFTGGYISQKSIIAVDILGVANISSSFGLLICFQAIGHCTGPPLSGALKDATGSFIPLFYMGGGLMLCAGFLMVVSNIFLGRQRRREAEEADKKTTHTATLL